MKSTEQKIFGRNACLQFAKLKKTAVIRAYCTEERARELSGLLKFLAQQKRAYHLVSQDELNRICESEHHEGVCLLVERSIALDEAELLNEMRQLKKSATGCLLCLDGIANPHNLGAIARSAAHFGIKNIFICNVPASAQKGLLSGAYHRTAEGGAVHVQIYCSETGRECLEKLKQTQGWKILATSSHGRVETLHRTRFPQHVVLVMGAEATGVSADILKIADSCLKIEGTGQVESLNVASATAIVLNEFSRQSSLQRLSNARSPAKPTRVARTDGRKRSGS